MKKLPVWVEKAGGLSFTCTRCGDCCTGEPGHVWVGEEEIEALARHLGVTRDVFGQRYLRRAGEDLSLVEKPDGDCVFWERGRGCTVYPARPVQCRTYPFWPENIVSRAAWREEAGRCPGLASGLASGEGRHYGPEEILRLANGVGETGPGAGDRAVRSAAPRPRPGGSGDTIEGS